MNALGELLYHDAVDGCNHTGLLIFAISALLLTADCVKPLDLGAFGHDVPPLLNNADR